MRYVLAESIDLLTLGKQHKKSIYNSSTLVPLDSKAAMRS